MPAIVREYGSAGVGIWRKMMEILREELYTYIEPEIIKGTLVIFRTLDDKIPDYMKESVPFDYAEFLAQELEPSRFTDTAAIQIRNDGGYLLWKRAAFDWAILSAEAIVYLYNSRKEYLVIRENRVEIFNPSKAHASVFSIPTFRELKDALESYKRRMVRTSQCKIFSSAWNDSDRLFFRNEPKPEAILRNSLWQFLSSVLGAEVRPEQIVDESHPCDIKVTWMLTNRLAFIEIKWLGKSLSAEGRITSNHTDVRAREGARQLADYLDANRTQAPTHETRGYLVVIDARRRGLTGSSTSIDHYNGLWYKDREVEYKPEYHKVRTDFEQPIRMYAEPICRPN